MCLENTDYTSFYVLLPFHYCRREILEGNRSLLFFSCISNRGIYPGNVDHLACGSLMDAGNPPSSPHEASLHPDENAPRCYPHLQGFGAGVIVTRRSHVRVLAPRRYFFFSWFGRLDCIRSSELNEGLRKARVWNNPSILMSS